MPDEPGEGRRFAFESCRSDHPVSIWITLPHRAQRVPHGRSKPMHRQSFPLIPLLMLAILAASAPATMAQGIDPENRPIAAVRFEGLDLVPEQLVRNTVRSTAGEAYDGETVRGDVIRLTHLGRFTRVIPRVSQPGEDGAVVLTFVLTEAPLLTDVQVVGNKAIADSKLLEAVRLRAGDPADPFLVENGITQITEVYEEQGYYVASVTIGRELLDETGVLIYRVREGPRIKIVGFDFEGNTTFTDSELQRQIKSRKYFPIFIKGALSREQLELDAGAIRQYYQARGYLDAQVGRRISLSPDETDAVVVFVIDEGLQYTVADIRVEGNTLFTAEQIRQNMTLVPGAVLNGNELRKSGNNIIDMYGRLGFIETTIRPDRTRESPTIEPLFRENEQKVDLLVRINEGSPYLVGKVAVRGNAVTRDKVILRQLRGLEPGRPFDRTGLDTTRQRLSTSSIFSEGTVTILGDPEDEQRDVLIQVQEGQTGSIGFGAGVSSDAGIIGSIDIIQRNFDVTDYPESFNEFITGQAFRGAGQYFALSLQPGNETSRYSISFREPYLFESDFFFDASLFFFTREREDWDEQRIGGALGIGQRFGDIWSASVRGRAEQIDITNLSSDAPVDAFAVEGGSFLTSLGLVVARDTTNHPFTPSEGSRLELSLEQIGALGGDYTFTRIGVKHTVYWTINEDFLGRKSILSWRNQIGYIPQENEAPLFERFYAGGFRTFRGFEFRGVGPRGIIGGTGPNAGQIGDDPVGGDFLLLTSLQYEFPLVTEFLRGVIFTDQGTVQDNFGVSEWRVSVGTGIRMNIPFLGQAPFALDIAYPILKQDGDQSQIISFDLAIPFQ